MSTQKGWFGHFWMSPDAQTVIWAQQQKEHPQNPDTFVASQLLLMYRDEKGNLILPVRLGMHVGFGIYNVGQWRAYPSFLEKLNLFWGGPTEANACSVDHMLEIPPGERSEIDTWIIPGGRGRPILVVPRGQGYAAGEHTTGSSQNRGLFEIFRRSVHPDFANVPSPMQAIKAKKAAEEAKAAELRNVSTEHAAIGAGKEVAFNVFETQVQYLPDAELLCAIQFEMQEALIARGITAPPSWVFPLQEDGWWKKEDMVNLNTKV